jgi:hypothetical protein
LADPAAEPEPEPEPDAGVAAARTLLLVRKPPSRGVFESCLLELLFKACAEMTAVRSQ